MLTIVCDTNFYRQLTRDLAGNNMSPDEVKSLMQSIKQKERAAGIWVGLSHVVWFELFAMLAVPHVDLNVNCVNALIASLLHSQNEVNSPECTFLPGYEALLVGEIFGHYDLSEDLGHYNQFCLVAKEFHDFPIEATAIKFAEFLKSIASYVQSREQSFIDTYNKFLYQRFSNEMTDLQALATVDAKMKFLNKLLDGPELKAAFYKVMAVLAYNVSDKKKIEMLMNVHQLSGSDFLCPFTSSLICFGVVLTMMW